MSSDFTIIITLITSGFISLITFSLVFFAIMKANKANKERYNLGNQDRNVYEGGKYVEPENPPREISKEVKIGLFFGKTWVQIMFLLIFILSVITILVIKDNKGYFEINKGVFTESTGVIQSIYKRAATGKNSAGKYYYELDYKYSTEIVDYNGDFVQTGVCYFPTTFNPQPPLVKVGDSILLKYSKNYPESSKVISFSDCTTGNGNVFIVPTIMLAIVFLILIGRFLFWYLSTIELLKNGVFSYGKLIYQKYHSGKNAHWILTFKYQSTNGNFYEKSLSISSKTEANSLMDDKDEALIYSEKNPKNVIFFDILGGKLSISESGKLKSLMANPYILLILPVFSISSILWVLKTFSSIVL